MGRWEGRRITNPGSKKLAEQLAQIFALVERFPAILAALIFSSLLGFAQLVHAGQGDQQSESASGYLAAKADPHSGMPEYAALREYAIEVGLRESNAVARTASGGDHAHVDNDDILALRKYAGEIGITAETEAASGGMPDWFLAAVMAVIHLSTVPKLRSCATMREKSWAERKHRPERSKWRRRTTLSMRCANF
jgi:hypothetical protein